MANRLLCSYSGWVAWADDQGRRSIDCHELSATDSSKHSGDAPNRVSLQATNGRLDCLTSVKDVSSSRPMQIRFTCNIALVFKNLLPSRRMTAVYASLRTF